MLTRAVHDVEGNCVTPIIIEGYTPDEILALPTGELESLVITGEPLAFRAGTAEILGEFAISGDCLRVELAHIEGGGEGVLPTLWLLCERYARARGLSEIEWIVYATNCARPNPKLPPLLARRGFTVRDVAGRGEAYYQRYDLA